MSMQVSGVDYESLMAQPDLQDQFKGAIKRAISNKLGVREEAVTVRLYSGSVIVEALILPPSGAHDAVLATLQASQAALVEAATSQVTAIPNISSVSTGEISVGGLSIVSGTDASTADTSAAARDIEVLPSESSETVAAAGAGAGIIAVLVACCCCGCAMRAWGRKGRSRVAPDEAPAKEAPRRVLPEGRGPEAGRAAGAPVAAEAARSLGPAAAAAPGSPPQPPVESPPMLHVQHWAEPAGQRYAFLRGGDD